MARGEAANTSTDNGGPPGGGAGAVAVAVNLTVAAKVPDSHFSKIDADPIDEKFDPQGKVPGFKQAAFRVAKSTCHFLSDASQQVLCEGIKASNVGKLRGDHEKGEYILISHFSSLAGESSSKPHIRPPSVRPGYLKKLVTAVLQSRDDSPDDIHPGDLWHMYDSGKHGLEPTLFGPFVKANGKPMQKERETYKTKQPHYQKYKQKHIRTMHSVSLLPSPRFGTLFLHYKPHGPAFFHAVAFFTFGILFLHYKPHGPAFFDAVARFHFSGMFSSPCNSSYIMQ